VNYVFRAKVKRKASVKLGVVKFLASLAMIDVDSIYYNELF
jgi:hypothetical protein